MAKTFDQKLGDDLRAPGAPTQRSYDNKTPVEFLCECILEIKNDNNATMLMFLI